MTAIRNHRFARRRVAIVLANPSVSSTTGWPVGFWWSELTHPYVAFTEAGYEIEIFSPIGGDCEPDAMSDPRDPSGYSASDIVSMGFLSTPSLLARTRETQRFLPFLAIPSMPFWWPEDSPPCLHLERLMTCTESFLSSLRRVKLLLAYAMVPLFFAMPNDRWNSFGIREDGHRFHQCRRRLCRPSGSQLWIASSGWTYHAVEN